MTYVTSKDVLALAARVEAFVRGTVIPYEQSPLRDSLGPTEELVDELRQKARAAGVLTPHIRPDGRHLNQRETATVLKKTGLPPLGPIACNTMAPDEGNMYLLGKIGAEAQRAHFLAPLVDGVARSAFLMTEPATEDGAGSDPSMMKTTARYIGNEWVINGRKAFITGFRGAKVGIVMANSGTPDQMAATMFLVNLPHPAITLDRVLDTIDSSMPGGHSILTINNLRVAADQILGEAHQGFNTRKSACRLPVSRTACVGMARQLVLKNSPCLIRVNGTPSVSC